MEQTHLNKNYPVPYFYLLLVVLFVLFSARVPEESFLMKFPLITSHVDTKHFNCDLQKKKQKPKNQKNNKTKKPTYTVM